MNKALLAISGGLDSTFVLWDWLCANPNGHLYLFHIELRHAKEDRLHSERMAVRNIIKWLRKEGFKNYTYIGTSVSDYGDLPRISIKDIQHVALWKAVILKTPQWSDIDTVLLSWHKGEVDRDDIRRGYRVKAMFEALEVGRPINLEFPIENKTRSEMIAEMPAELLNFVKSCRRPRQLKPCGTCKTCVEYIQEGLKPR